MQVHADTLIVDGRGAGQAGSGDRELADLLHRHLIGGSR